MKPKSSAKPKAEEFKVAVAVELPREVETPAVEAPVERKKTRLEIEQEAGQRALQRR